MVEVYGIPKEVYNCWGCQASIKLLESLQIPYQFYEVVKRVDNELGFEYNRPKIEELAKRINSGSLKITYPQIFIDGVHIGGYDNLRKYYDG